jgi:hypothetical protein
MPVVFRCNQIPRGIVAVSQCLLIVLTFCMSPAGVIHAQDPAVQQAAPAATSDEARTPQADPAPGKSQPENAAIQQPAQDCLQTIIDQQALTRKIRDINSPLERIDEPKYLQLKRTVTTNVQNGTDTAAEIENLTLALKYRLFQATDPSFVANPDNVKGLLNEMEREVKRAGSQAGNAQRIKAYRQKYCDAVLAVAKQMFDNNLDARAIAIQVIKELNVNTTAVGLVENHPESLSALIGLLKDPEQPNSVKVITAAAISYVLTTTAVVPQQQADVSDAIADELDRPCTEPEYQLILLDTLCDLTVARKPVGAPVTTGMRTFVKIADDRNRRIDVRCRAAFGIGQGAYDERINFDALAFKIAVLALDASQFFNQAPGNPAWQQCGVDLFFALRHEDKNGLTKKLPLLPQGIMNRAGQSEVVNDSGQLVLKIAVPLVVNNAKIPQADQVALDKWIKANQALANKSWE